MAQSIHVLMPVQGQMQQSPFAAVIETLMWGLREAGHDASFAFDAWRDGATLIVLCPHLLDDNALARLPSTAILYNLDQIAPSSPLPPSRLWRLRHWRIWDYSVRNQAVWASLGIQATLVPIGWYPGLDRIGDAAAGDIDVLFYGALSHRREAVLKRLAALGLRTVVCGHVFGDELDALIGRAKVVLNVHFHPAHVLETVRLSYLLANGRAVVSERSERTEVPEPYEDTVCWAPYHGLAEACLGLAGSAERRAALGLAGRAATSRLPIVPILERALASPLSRLAEAA